MIGFAICNMQMYYVNLGALIEKRRGCSQSNNLFLTICHLFVVSVYWIVSGVVQSSALLALQGPTGDEVAHLDHST
jgi:hypothetical protein